MKKTDTAAAPSAGDTRKAILDHLKRGGPQSANGLGETLGFTAMAARLHLYDLQAEGLVTAEAKASGRGRPTKHWRLTDKAEDVFPDAHQGLAVGLIESVKALFGDEGMDALVNRHGDGQRRDYRSALKGAKSLGARVKKLAELREREGYMASTEQDGEDWLLYENHCPICSAAKACSGLCKNELQVFQDVLGPDVNIVREAHILTGARRCAYRISKAK